METQLDRPNAVFCEIRAPKVFVNAFLVGNNILSIERNSIQSLGDISRGHFVCVPLKELSNDVVGSELYQDPFHNRPYVFLIYSNGHLEMRDEKLKVVTSCDLQIDTVNHEPLIIFDKRFRRLYVSLDRHKVLKLNIETGEDAIVFNKGKTYDCIYTSNRKIVSVKSCWIENTEVGDVFSMAIFLQDQFDGNRYLEIVDEIDMIRNKWSTTYCSEKLRIAEHAQLSYIPEFGVILLTSDETQFFQTHSELIDRNAFKVFSRKSLICTNRPNNTFFIPEVYEINSGSGTKVLACSNLGHMVEIDVPLHIVDSTHSIRGEDMLGRMIKIKGWEAKDLETVVRIVQLQDKVFLLVSKSEGMIFLDLHRHQVISHVLQESHSVLYANMITGGATDLGCLIMCGGNTGSKGFIEIRQLGFDGKLKIRKLRTMESLRDNSLWHTDEGFWWKNEHGDLFKEHGLIERNSKAICVTFRGRIIFPQKDVLLTQPISIDEEDSLVTIAQNGTIHWSDSNRIVKIPGFQESFITPAVCSSKVRNGQMLTVVAWGKKSFWVYDSKSLLIDLEDMEQVSSCLIKTANGMSYVIMADAFGHIKILSDEGAPLSKCRVCSHKLSLCDLGSTANILAYCHETVVLIKLTRDDFMVAPIEVPFHTKLISSFTEFSQVAMDNNNCLYELDFRAIINEQPKPIIRSISSKKNIIEKFISFDLTRRYIVVSAFSSKFDTVLEKYVHMAKLQTYDIVSKRLISDHDITKTYPQASVSDLITVPFQKKLLCGEYIDNETQYAKQLVLSKCFAVSLHYELAEDEGLHNLLLFTIDELTGQIEFRLGLRTGFSISSLTNFYNRIIFVSGECIQAYQLDYSVKENEFKLERISEELRVDGLTKNCFFIPQCSTISSNLKRRKKHSFGKERIGIVNIFKGFQEFDLSISSSTKTSTEVLAKKLDHLHLRRTLASDYDPITKMIHELKFVTSCILKVFGTDEEGKELNNVETSLARENMLKKYLAAADGDNNIFLAEQVAQDDGDFIGDTLRFKLSDQIVGIHDFRPSNSYSDNINVHYKRQRSAFFPLFLISTANGGCFLISTILDEVTLQNYHRDKDMNFPHYQKHLEKIGISALNDSDFTFFDERQMVTNDSIYSIY
ncbi:LAFE_0F11936g1_1 [Lachancea fermentati]|uniref:LAFE_0F11936g1_1 n=1 Tax=Lachancea fermentati TaxID=4955 RepID=A0A1G4MFM5_LACFM|nr:LAFE_0F11936g1_1 [Lachancea fermentati]